MHEFAKRLTIGFVFALLVAGAIGYGGVNRKVLPLYEEEFNQQSICAEFFQKLRAFLGDSPATILSYNYFSGVEFPLPVAGAPETFRPF